MKIEEVRSTPIYMSYASLVLRRDFDYKQADESESTIDECIKVAFDGNVDEFVEEADWYIGEGCGVVG